MSTLRHGKWKTPVYYAWSSMKARCSNPKNADYENYGGRGIKVCERWLTFENFYADMGDPPAGLELDRINNDGNYEPGNCRWATLEQQSRNRRGARLITFNGITKCASEWAADLGVGVSLIYGRLKQGWPVEDALTIKPIPKHLTRAGRKAVRTEA